MEPCPAEYGLYILTKREPDLTATFLGAERSRDIECGSGNMPRPAEAVSLSQADSSSAVSECTAAHLPHAVPSSKIRMRKR